MSEYTDTKVVITSGLIGVIFGLVTSAYYALLAAPAVVATRPRLATLPLQTALFSGRFTEWAFYTHPTVAIIGTCSVCALMALVISIAMVMSA